MRQSRLVQWSRLLAAAQGSFGLRDSCVEVRLTEGEVKSNTQDGGSGLAGGEERIDEEPPKGAFVRLGPHVHLHDESDSYYVKKE